MAQRRMFSPAIVESDAFLDMPTSSQALYFHLGMYADDDGFVNPKKIMRMIGSTDDDLRVIITKRFVLPFENGVVVIKHWRINNLLRKDWHKETQYLEQKNLLEIKENGSYTEKNPLTSLVNEPLTIRQHSIVNNRLDKISLSNNILEYTPTQLMDIDLQEISDKYKVPLHMVKLAKEEMDNWLEAKGKRYKNYKAGLRNWVLRDAKKVMEGRANSESRVSIDISKI